MPPIFAVTIAYIGDEWPHNEATTAAGIYSSGSSLGGFGGRLVAEILADLISWRAGLELADMTLAGAIAVAFLLPPERKFVRSAGLLASGRQMLAHFRNSQLLATFADRVSAYCFVSSARSLTSAFISRGALPNLSATWLGAIFVVYLTGSVLTPWTGWAVGRFGRRRFVVRIIALWVGGIALTLVPTLTAVIVGLALCAGCGLICQSVSTGYVTITAKAGRSSAVGLYVTSFYLGGSFGAGMGGIAWTYGAWPACVALVVGMLAIMALVVIFAWARRVPSAPMTTPIEPA